MRYVVKKIYQKFREANRHAIWGLITYAPSGQKRTVAPNSEIGIEGLPVASARAVCAMKQKKPASRGLLIAITDFH